MGTSATCEDPNEMQHDAAFHQDLHSLLRLEQPTGIEREIYYYLKFEFLLGLWQC